MNLEQLIQLDQEITLWVNSFHSPLTDSLWIFLSDTKIWFPAYGVVMGVLIWRLGWKRGVAMILAMILTVVVADQVSHAVRDSVVQRLRPCYTTWMLENGLHWPLPRYSFYGFFSSHASNVFSFAVVSTMALNMDKAHSHRLYIAGVFLWATLVSVSRMMVSAHFFGDVLAGAVFGVAVGLAIGCLFRWIVVKAKL